MHPPPSTPTPRRFLLPKRGTQASSQTPAAAVSTPRFQSTPRFGAAAASSSAARPIGRRALSQELEDVEEPGFDSDDDAFEEEERVVSSSVPDEEQADGGGPKEKHRPADDIVEADEDFSKGPQGSEWGYEGILNDEVEIVKESTSPEERRVKRRRLSLTPGLTSSPGPVDLPATASEDGQPVADEEETHPSAWSGSEEEALPRFDNEEEEIDLMAHDVPALQQPTFRAAPRFKPTEADAIAQVLPTAFSPQRRGAKYLPGGLAAELQGWLSDVKRWDEEGGVAMKSTNGGSDKFRVRVEEVRAGGRMYLVSGRVEATDTTTRPERFILAGEGRLTGLGRRAEVRPGSLVEVEGPVWEVELVGSSWTVSCEWSVI